MRALCQAFDEEDVPDELIDALGCHSLMFFGVNRRLFEIAYLAVAGEKEYSLERLAELMQVRVSVDDIIKGDGDALDALRWLDHVGRHFAGYLVKVAQ